MKREQRRRVRDKIRQAVFAAASAGALKPDLEAVIQGHRELMEEIEIAVVLDESYSPDTADLED